MITDGTTNVPPPIASRFYQEIGNALMAYKNAYLCAWVPLPFCFAQLVAFYVVLMILTLPLFSVYQADIDGEDSSSNIWFVPIIASIGMLCYCGLDITAAEMEQPFGTDANDLPIRDLQLRFLDSVTTVCEYPLPKCVDANIPAAQRYDGEAEQQKRRMDMDRDPRKRARPGWEKVKVLNKELLDLNLGHNYDFAQWCGADELVNDFELKFMARKFRGLPYPADVARHLRRRIRKLNRPPVTIEQIDEKVDENLEWTKKIEDLEFKRAGILEELGPRRLAAGGSDMVRKDHSHARHTVNKSVDFSMTAEEMDELELLGEPGDWGGLRLARLREQRNLYDILTADVTLETARAGGTNGLQSAVEELREEVGGLQAALEQTREAIQREETSRMDKLHEAEQTRKDIADLVEARETLLAKSKMELENRESENDDDPSDNPRELRMKVWGAFAAKKVDELYDFFAGRGPKGGGGNRRTSTLAGRKSLAGGALGDPDGRRSSALGSDNEPSVRASMQSFASSEEIARGSNQNISRAGTQNLSRAGTQSLERAGTQSLERAGTQNLSRAGTQSLILQTDGNLSGVNGSK